MKCAIYGAGSLGTIKYLKQDRLFVLCVQRIDAVHMAKTGRAHQTVEQ